MEAVPEVKLDRDDSSREERESRAPFQRGEEVLADKIERRENVRNMIRDEVSRIESALKEGEGEPNLDEYFDFYGKVAHLTPLAEKIGEKELSEKLSRLGAALEKIKKERQKKIFKGLTSRMSFKKSAR